MLRKTLALVALVFSVSIVSAQSADQSSEASSVRTGVILERGEGQVTLWTGEAQEVVTFNSDTLMPRRSLEPGNLIWAETSGPASNEAQRIILIDEESSVASRRSSAIRGNLRAPHTSSSSRRAVKSSS
jgi:hypothetical protein